MHTRRLNKSELKWTDSDYLCMLCYDPLYYNAKIKKEICANPKCILYQSKPKIFQYDPNHKAVKPFVEAFDEEILQLKKFSKQFLYTRLYEIRAKACSDFFKNKGLKLNHILGIDYILVKIANNNSFGISTNDEHCDNHISKTLKKYDDLNFIEDLELKNYLIDEENIPYVMKYYDVIMEIRKVLGIVNSDKFGPEDVNSFYFLDRKARVGKPSGPYDFTTIFQNHME